MHELHNRLFLNNLKEALGVMPVVVVSGARQTGKTTLVRDLLGADQGWKYYTLDDLTTLEVARNNPEALLGELPVIIDEVQRVPEMFLVVKRMVDKERRKGGIILTGSANLALMENVADSLAGRAVYLNLPPFSPLEWKDVAQAEVIQFLFEKTLDASRWEVATRDWVDAALTGGFPGVLDLNTQREKQIWFSGYVQTYLERDLRQLSQVGSLVEFQRFMSIVANRVGKIVNQSEVARDVGLTQPTCHRYLNLLETGCLIERISNFSINPTVGLVKGKKLFWTDVGLAAYLAKIYDRKGMLSRIDVGFWMEQLVYQSLQTWKSMGYERSVYYYRDRSKYEVDFVLEHGNELVAIEIKLSAVVRSSDLRGIRRLQEIVKSKGRSVRGIVLYTGGIPISFGEEAYALPVGCLF